MLNHKKNEQGGEKMNWGSRNLSDGREQARIPYICNTPEGWDEFIKGTLLLAPTHSLNLWDKGKGWNVRCPWMERLSALLASLRWWTFYRSFQSQTSQSSKLSSSLSIHNPIPNEQEPCLPPHLESELVIGGLPTPWEGVWLASSLYPPPAPD